MSDIYRVRYVWICASPLPLASLQMCLFYAPAFFAHLLGWALTDPAHRGLASKVTRRWVEDTDKSS